MLFMLIMTLWSGLMMFKLNDSGKESNKSVHVSLTIATVATNVLFVVALIVILLRQIIQEQREEGSSLVLKMDRLCGWDAIEKIDNGDMKEDSNMDQLQNDGELEMVVIQGTEHAAVALKVTGNNNNRQSEVDRSTNKSRMMRNASNDDVGERRPVSGSTTFTGYVRNPLDEGKQQQQQRSHHHSRDSTQLPTGWNKHKNEDGVSYYNRDGTQETQWDAPEGSTGGSTSKK